MNKHFPLCKVRRLPPVNNCDTCARGTRAESFGSRGEGVSDSHGRVEGGHDRQVGQYLSCVMKTKAVYRERIRGMPQVKQRWGD